jgi:hypothetical protein
MTDQPALSGVADAHRGGVLRDAWSPVDSAADAPSLGTRRGDVRRDYRGTCRLGHEAPKHGYALLATLKISRL